MRGRLEGAFKINDKRVVNCLQDFLLRFHMLDLFQPDDLTFLKTLQCEGLRIVRLAFMFDQPDSAEGSRAQCGQKFEIIQLEFPLLFPSQSRCFITIVSFSVNHRFKSHELRTVTLFAFGVRRDHLKLPLKLFLLLLEL